MEFRSIDATAGHLIVPRPISAKSPHPRPRPTLEHHRGVGDAVENDCRKTSGPRAVSLPPMPCGRRRVSSVTSPHIDIDYNEGRLPCESSVS